MFAPPCPRACQVFGVCCALWVGVVLLSLCQSLVDLVLTVKNPCDVSNQSKYVFISATSVRVWSFCFCGNSAINAHVVRTCGKGSLFSHCFIFPMKFIPCVLLLPPVKKRVQFFLVLPPVRSSPLPGDHEFFISLSLDLIQFLPPNSLYYFVSL